MIKYKRRTINQKAHLHDKEFVTAEDAGEALLTLANIALECGADKEKLMEFFTNEKA